MAFTKRPTNEHIEAVRRQLGGLIARFHRSAFRTTTPELGESFKSYVLGANTASPQFRWDGDIPSLVTETSSWHHQVSSGGKPIGVAHSELGNNGTWSLTSFFLSTRATKFAEAVAKLDRDRQDENVEILLVKAPLHQIDFFILRSVKEIEANAIEAHLVASENPSKELAEGNFYPIEELLRRLSAVPQPPGLFAPTRIAVPPGP
jgi:hypothetical protein